VIGGADASRYEGEVLNYTTATNGWSVSAAFKVDVTDAKLGTAATATINPVWKGIGLTSGDFATFKAQLVTAEKDVAAEKKLLKVCTDSKDTTKVCVVEKSCKDIKALLPSLVFNMTEAATPKTKDGEKTLEDTTPTTPKTFELKLRPESYMHDGIKEVESKNVTTCTLQVVSALRTTLGQAFLGEVVAELDYENNRIGFAASTGALPSSTNWWVIVLCAVLAIVLIGVVAFCVWRKRNQDQQAAVGYEAMASRAEV